MQNGYDDWRLPTKEELANFVGDLNTINTFLSTAGIETFNLLMIVKHTLNMVVLIIIGHQRNAIQLPNGFYQLQQIQQIVELHNTV